MYDKIRDQYDSLYSAQTNVFGAGKPLKAVVELPSYLPSGQVLDIGGGEGRNALYLAEHGYAVTVYDISAVGIASLLNEAKERNQQISTRVVDITQEDIDGTFDAVINSFVLHHFTDADARRCITDAQTHTHKGGIHILYTFANEGGLYERSKKSERFYPSEQTMRELYPDWNIIELTTYETVTHARDKSGERMLNKVVMLIARKE